MSLAELIGFIVFVTNPKLKTEYLIFSLLSYFGIFSFTDLSTLANVVTTLALMGKQDGEQPDPAMVSNGNPSDDMESVAKAFDTLAKAIQPIKQDNQV